MRGKNKMYPCRTLSALVLALFSFFLPVASAQAQVNAFSCTNCNVYDVSTLPPNSVVLALHYYCDNSTNERAEIFYAPVAGASVTPLAYVTADDKLYIKGRVSSSYAQFYNAASGNNENNGSGTDQYSTLSSNCRSKLQGAGLTNASGVASHTLDLSFQYGGLTVFSRDSHGLATAFEVRAGHAGATNSGTANGASVRVRAQEKFNMENPAVSFKFQAANFAQGWLMGDANEGSVCPRLSGAASASDWLFKPTFKKYISQCNDGIDNDGDGKIDYPTDPGCSGPDDNTEQNPQCSDGIDNDGDGATDYPADFSCSGPTDDDETNPKAQCQDGLDNDSDGKIDYPQDPGCTSKQDNDEFNQTAPNAPTVQASDGTQVRRIDVTWTNPGGATSYDLYRSENPNAFNDPNFTGKIASNLTGLSYNDTDPIIEPGVKYYYSVKAKNSFGTSGFAVPDPGYALCSVGHCDCDGNSDAVEQQDGTNQCDGGDFILHLKSPAFTKYNTFLTQFNYLELVASGTKDMPISVTVYRINGSVLAKSTVNVPAGTEFDVDINAMVGIKDTYGLVRIDFDDYTPGSSLMGRISNYRSDPGASTYSFAFTKELRNTTTGAVYAASNSIDPQGQQFLVPNWMEVMNVEDTQQTFNYRLYTQDGRFIRGQTFNLPPRGEFDLQAGHEDGQGVYLAEVIPANPDAKYFATVSRYSSNAFGGSEAPTYNFAFSVEARKGTGSAMYAPTTNKTGSTWTQTNWIEVANTRDAAVPVTIDFRNASGALISSQPFTLAPKAQMHWNGGGILSLNGATAGSVKVSSTSPNSIITTSMVYYHDVGNFLQTAYISLARVAGPSKQIGSVNSFLQMKNELTLLNTSTGTYTATVNVQPFGQAALPTVNFTFGASGTAVNTFENFPAESYGVVRVATPTFGQAAGEILRVREIGGKVDFAFPTAVQ